MERISKSSAEVLSGSVMPPVVAILDPLDRVKALGNEAFLARVRQPAVLSGREREREREGQPFGSCLAEQLTQRKLGFISPQAVTTARLDSALPDQQIANKGPGSFLPSLVWFV